MLSKGMRDLSLETKLELLRIEKLMREKKEAQGGIARGFHGTSALRARAMELTGKFNNYTCILGMYGVHFHDEDRGDNAHAHGRYKAQDDKDNQYAVMEVSSPAAVPNGYPYQWIAHAESITILNVKYYNLDKTPVPANE